MLFLLRKMKLYLIGPLQSMGTGALDRPQPPLCRSWHGLVCSVTHTAAVVRQPPCWLQEHQLRAEVLQLVKL